MRCAVAACGSRAPTKPPRSSPTSSNISPRAARGRSTSRYLEVDRPRAARGEMFEDVGDDLGGFVGALDPHAATAHRIQGTLLVLHLVQPAEVGTDLAAGHAR